jgi:hypothetical protein
LGNTRNDVKLQARLRLWKEHYMHAINQVTPEVLLVMCIGGIAFILIFKAIFKKPK